MHKTLQIRLVGFNLSSYKSLDKRLRLNQFKKILQRTRVRHIPLHLSDDQRSQLNCAIGRSTCCHVTCAHKNEKIVTHEMGAISLFIHTRAHTCAQAHTHAHVHVCDTWRSHTPSRGTAVLFAPRQLSRQHVIKKYFLFILFQNKSN